MEWSRWLATAPAHSSGVTVLDQGPVYALARLGLLTPPLRGTEPSSAWWGDMTAHWAGALDAIVCAWVGACIVDGTAEAFGDQSAAIWVPTR